MFSLIHTCAFYTCASLDLTVTQYKILAASLNLSGLLTNGA